MHKWEALAVIIVWEVRGSRQNLRHRATAVSMVTASKERPSSSTLSLRIIDAAIGDARRSGSAHRASLATSRLGLGEAKVFVQHALGMPESACYAVNDAQ